MIILRLLAFFLGLLLIVGGGACLLGDVRSLFSAHGRQDFGGFLFIAGVGVSVVIGGWKLFQYGRYRDEPNDSDDS